MRLCEAIGPNSVSKATIPVPRSHYPVIFLKSAHSSERVIACAKFGLRLRYYNGPSVIPRRLLLTVPINTRGFACLAGTLIRLLRSGHGYVEVPYQTGERQHGRTKAFMVKNIISVLNTIAALFWEVRIKDRHKYPGAARRIEARI